MSIPARSQSISTGRIRTSERNCRAHWPGLVRSAAFLHFAIIIDRIISWTNGDCMVFSAKLLGAALQRICSRWMGGVSSSLSCMGGVSHSSRVKRAARASLPRLRRRALLPIGLHFCPPLGPVPCGFGPSWLRFRAVASASKLLGAALAIVRGAILAHSFCRKYLMLAMPRSFWSHAGSSNLGVLHVLHLIRDGQFWVLHALHAHDQRRVRCHFGSASASGSSLDTNFRQVGQHKEANSIWRQNFL